MMRHEGRVAVVTGAGSGIGRAIALRLATDAAAVACADINTAGAEETAREIIAVGGHANSFTVDVADDGSVAALRDAVFGAFGQADILCSIAGIIVRESLAEHDVATWRHVLDVNLTGMFLCAKAFIPGMRSRGWGRIINMGSTSGLTGYYYPSYAASKAGVINFTRSLVLELGDCGVTSAPARSIPRSSAQICSRSSSPVSHSGASGRRRKSPPSPPSSPATMVIDGGATAVFKFLD